MDGDYGSECLRPGCTGERLEWNGNVRVSRWHVSRPGRKGWIDGLMD